MKYHFTVTETLTRFVVIEAASEKEAYKKGEQMYQNEEIVLTSEDFTDVDFAIRECTEEEMNE